MEDYTSEFIDEESDLYEHYTFTVDKGQSPLRIDKYLMNRIENATRNKIQAGAKNGSIFVNNIPVKSNYKVKPYDAIRVLFTHPPHRSEEHTSELQSRENLVCRLLLEKKKRTS